MQNSRGSFHFHSEPRHPNLFKPPKALKKRIRLLKERWLKRMEKESTPRGQVCLCFVQIYTQISGKPPFKLPNLANRGNLAQLWTKTNDRTTRFHWLFLGFLGASVFLASVSTCRGAREKHMKLFTCPDSSVILAAAHPFGFRIQRVL